MFGFDEEEYLNLADLRRSVRPSTCLWVWTLLRMSSRARNVELWKRQLGLMFAACPPIFIQGFWCGVHRRARNVWNYVL